MWRFLPILFLLIKHYDKIIKDLTTGWCFHEKTINIQVKSGHRKLKGKFQWCLLWIHVLSMFPIFALDCKPPFSPSWTIAIPVVSLLLLLFFYFSPHCIQRDLLVIIRKWNYLTIPPPQTPEHLLTLRMKFTAFTSSQPLTIPPNPPLAVPQT